MAFFPVALGHSIQPFVQPCGVNSLPPSPPPETCLWSSHWSWGTEQWQQVHREIKGWSQMRKEKQNTRPRQPAILLRTIPWEGPSFQPPRTGMSMQSRTSYVQGASWVAVGCQDLHRTAPSALCHHSTTLLLAAARGRTGQG